MAAKPFGKYIPEKDRSPEIREQQSVLSKRDLNSIRQLRTMLKMLDPEAAFGMFEFHTDVSFFEALQLAKEEGKLIVPNIVHDNILGGVGIGGYFSTPWNMRRDNTYNVWTGTMIIYTHTGKKFGEYVYYGPFVFHVPECFRGEVDCALVVEHPDFELVPTKRSLWDFIMGRKFKYELLVPNQDDLHLVRDLPTASPDYWCTYYDKDFGVPVGLRDNVSLRYLMKTSDGYGSSVPYIGPLVRGDGMSMGNLKSLNPWACGNPDVAACFGPYLPFRVVLVG